MNTQGILIYETIIGYASTFREFMDILGVESETIRGEAMNGTGYGASHVTSIQYHLPSTLTLFHACAP